MPPQPVDSLLRLSRLRARRLGHQAWLVTGRGSRHRARRLGPAGTGAHLVWDPAAAERAPARFERALGELLARRHVMWLLRELEVDVVLDVGANVGQYARMLRRQGYRGRIVSFEPLPQYAEQLRQAAAGDPAWQVVECALGDEDGETEIHEVDGAMSSILPSSEFGRGWSAKLREASTRTIRIRRLEDVLDEVTAGLGSPRPFLKLDTQGYDLEAFRGAGARMAELVGLQSEVSMVPIYEGMPRMAEQLAAYEEAGFATTGLFPVTRHRPTLRVIEFDLVMIGPRALAERGRPGADG